MKKEHVTTLESVKYSEMFSDTKSQHSVVKIFQHNIERRVHFRAPSLNPTYLGLSTGTGD